MPCRVCSRKSPSRLKPRFVNPGEKSKAVCGGIRTQIKTEMNPIESTHQVQVGEHQVQDGENQVTVFVADFGPVAHITAEAADPAADVPVGDFICEFGRIYCDFIKKPALLAIPSTAFLLWMEGNRLRIEASHPP